MRKLLLLYFSIVSFFAFSQQGNFVTENEYRYKKSNNLLTGDEIVITESMINPNTVINNVNYIKKINLEKDNCQGYTDPLGAPGTLSSSDDGSTPVINLPFNFCFFGDTYTSVYLNGNGNISFQSSNTGYSSSAFPSTSVTMIAAFWADFDFGSCGDVYATVTPTAAIFNWVDAGYFNEQCDKVNTCQIIITDGTDPLIPGGNVAIHYADMQWTTGSASSGINGFGGTPATAGANRGNGIDYFQIGQFDHAGNDYDGPNGNNDGVDFLDNRSFLFDFCNTTGGNLPPSAQNNNNCTPYQVCKQAGNDLEIVFPFIGPENNQTISSITYSSPTLTNITEVSNTSGAGYTGILTLSIDGNLETLGMHDLTIEATDNLGAVTSISYQIEVVDFNIAFPATPTVSYSQGCTPVTISVDAGPFDSYLWQDNTTSSSTVINTDFNGNFTVEVTNDGCVSQVSTPLSVVAAPFFKLKGSLEFCPDDLSTYLYLPDSLNLDSAVWISNTSSNEVSDLFSSTITSSGAYSITSYSFSAGAVCSSDTIINISTQQDLDLVPDLSTCDGTYQFLGNTGGSGSGIWTVPAGVTLSPNNTNLNPLVTLTSTGSYKLIYTEDGCSDKDSLIVTWLPIPEFNISSDFFVCPNELEHIEIVDSASFGSIDWKQSSTSFSNFYSVNLDAGTYTISATGLNGCNLIDTTFTITTQAPINIDQSTLSTCTNSINMSTNTGGDQNGNNGVWTFVSNDGLATFSNNSNINTTATFSAFGTYNLIFTDNNCSADDDTLNIVYSDKPYFNLENDGFFYCPLDGGQNFKISDSLQMNGISWNWSSLPTSADFSRLLTQGTHNLRLENQYGCTNDTTIIVTSQEEISLITPTPGGKLCMFNPEDTLAIFANSGGALDGNWSYTTSTGGTLNFLNNFATSNFTATEYGEYTITFTDDVCQESDETTFIITPGAYYNIQDYKVCEGYTQLVEAFIDTPDEFIEYLEWNTGETGKTITVNSEGYYSLEMSTGCGNPFIDTSFVDYRICDIEMPNIFTPNGDGVNDTYVIKGDTEIFKEFNIVITNRWGNIIIEYNDPSGVWKGENQKGEIVEDGVYFYNVQAVTLQNEPIVKKGFIQVVKN